MEYVPGIAGRPFVLQVEHACIGQLLPRMYRRLMYCSLTGPCNRSLRAPKAAAESKITTGGIAGRQEHPRRTSLMLRITTEIPHVIFCICCNIRSIFDHEASAAHVVISWLRTRRRGARGRRKTSRGGYVDATLSVTLHAGR
jgi:hypothetical protein